SSKVESQAGRNGTGADLYFAYCSACHGRDGKGGGPVAKALKTPPPDLTLLARNNGGKFPRDQVELTVRGEGNRSAHGSREMPVWGPFFLAMSNQSKNDAERRIRLLVDY